MMNVNSQGPDGSVLAVGEKWKGNLRPVINRERGIKGWTTG